MGYLRMFKTKDMKTEPTEARKYLIENNGIGL